MAPLFDAPLPRLHADLPGTGGTVKAEPEDFVVEEIPAYPPAGQGAHTFLWIEKRALTTAEAARRLAQALGVRPADVGTAGLKDRQATARQWISLPGVDPERALTLGEAAGPGLRVLEAHRHPHKLRTGHLRGNRFTVTLRGCEPDAPARARAILDRLAGRGMPNFYGEQRFGRGAQNAERGLAFLRGQARIRDRRERRLLISALQSALFNEVLRRRLAAGTLFHALAGDVLCKLASGGLFPCTDPATDQPRVEALEVAPTGPMFGPRAARPAPGSVPAELEQAVLAEAGLSLEELGRAGALAEGTRRPLLVAVGAPEILPAPAAGPLVLAFTLPAGSYATVLLREVTG